MHQTMSCKFLAFHSWREKVKPAKQRNCETSDPPPPPKVSLGSSRSNNSVTQVLLTKQDIKITMPGFEPLSPDQLSIRLSLSFSSSGFSVFFLVQRVLRLRESGQRTELLL